MSMEPKTLVLVPNHESSSSQSHKQRVLHASGAGHGPNDGFVLGRSKKWKKVIRHIVEDRAITTITCSTTTVKVPRPMSCLCWNARRLGNPRVLDELNFIIHREDPTLISLCETLLHDRKREFVCKNFGFQNCFVVNALRGSEGLICYGNLIFVSIQSFSCGHIDIAMLHGGEKKGSLPIPSQIHDFREAIEDASLMIMSNDWMKFSTLSKNLSPLAMKKSNTGKLSFEMSGWPMATKTRDGFTNMLLLDVPGIKFSLCIMQTNLPLLAQENPG
ncbi:conserved hypothetical protein [Ricinus communis]|uniref:Uncharacterized protein n=1 Tax=Ricinus communis TaxID=3988 RepID=B9RXA2_RICCO|nr:conserved hypothetical protein [Ricinus communis]